MYVSGLPSDESLFRYSSLLELVLAPHPELQIVLSTSWVQKFGFQFALSQLSPALQKRVVGAMVFPAPTRFAGIEMDVQSRGLTRWIALDDDLFGWPEEQRHLVVAPTNPVLALAQPGVAAELATMLDALCAGRSLELETRVINLPSTIDRLWTLPDVTEAEVINALEEDARCREIIRQARAPSPPATADSIETADRFMTEFRAASAMGVLARIECRELVNLSELASRLDVREDALRAATESGQLFSIPGPGGGAYYPAFFANGQYPKDALLEVSQALGTLPGPSKYYFLTSKSTRLGQTPLEALAEGRLADVLVSARGFRER